jgi:ParB-like chromosome segregation protein Spo0J
MLCEKTKDIRVLSVSCSDDQRYLPPTSAAIEAMKESLKAHGQINPIGVYPITSNTYRLISGATRFRAASEMGWRTIRASIWSGSAVDYQIHELTENIDRRELDAKQRREMRAKIKELQRQQFANVAPSKGGRGRKGGLREAARQEGIPRTTAQDRQREAKLAENDDKRPVSAAAPAAPPTPSSAFANKKYTIDIPLGDFRRLTVWCQRQNISIAEGMRRIIRERLDDEEPLKTANGANHRSQQNEQH